MVFGQQNFVAIKLYNQLSARSADNDLVRYNNNNNIEFRDYLGQRGDDSRDKVIDSKANEH